MPPSNIQIRKLEHASAAQVENMTQVLMEAFYNDWALGLCFNGLHVTDRQLYHDFMQMQAEDLADQGALWVAEDIEQSDETRRIVGLSGWYPSGVTFKGERLGPWLDRLPKDLKDWWTSYYLPRGQIWPKAWMDESVPKDNWFMIALAVSPNYQRQGIGQALFRIGVDKAHSDGKRAIWNTAPPANVALYESWGAVVRGSDVFVALDKQVFPMWVLEVPSSRK